MARINKDHLDKWFEHNVDLDNRTIWIGSIKIDDNENESGVDAKLSESVIKGIHLMEKSAPEGDKPFMIYLNTPGGSEFDGLAIHDAIKACRNHVTIIVWSKAWSMGSYILQAGDKRILAKNSTVMIHEGTLDLPPNEHPRIVKQWFKYYFDVQEPALNAILMDRIREKHPEFKDRKLEEMCKFDTILTPQQAIDLGLADEILEDF